MMISLLLGKQIAAMLLMVFMGYLIVRSMESGNMLNILVALIFIGSISALLSFLFSKLEKVVCPW